MRQCISILVIMVLLFLSGCDDERVEAPVPEIEFMLPVSGTKGTPVTLYGKGFTTNIHEIEVFFGEKPAEIITSDYTTILARVSTGTSTGNVMVRVRDRETKGPVFSYKETGESFPFTGAGFEGLENGDSSVARFTYPWGADADQDGNVYIADRGNHVIRKISPDGSVSTLAGTGKAGFANGTASEAEFNEPVDVAVDASGNVYVSDFLNTCVRKITLAGVVSTHAGLNGVVGNTNGSLSDARFAGPAGLAFDSNSNLYVADFYNHQIRKITQAGIVSTLAGSAAGCTDGTGAAAQLNSPFSIALDKVDNLYVTDGANHSIRKITPTGVVSRIAGTCSSGYKDGDAMTAMFNTPVGIALDDEGNIIVSDGRNNRLRKIYIETNMVETVAGHAVAGLDFGIGENALFNLPTDLVHLYDDVFLLVDFNNHRVVKVIVD
jgi:sugar lactone lactonase YvrE